MIDPYRMVFVNIVGLTVVFAGTLIYKFIYPRKQVNLFVLLVILSLIPVISIFRQGSYESGDFNIHVRRTMEFYKVLSEGNFIPTWAGDLNATYGYPLFAFNYILPYYIISFFHFLHFSFINSLKIFLSLNFIFSGALMFIFSKKYFKNELAAFAVSIFYLFAPYHLIALHFKVTIGEILAYTLMPFLLYLTLKAYGKKSLFFTLLSGLILGLIILSHIFVAVFLVPVIFVLLYTNSMSVAKSLILTSKITFISLAISAFQWASSFIYRPYLFTTAYPTDPIKAFYFPNIIDLLYSPWRFGLLFQGPRGELSFLLGYAQILTFCILLILLFLGGLKRENKRTLIFWILVFLLTVFLITPQSIFIWRLMPFINNAGSQRLLIFTALITSLFVGYLTIALKKKKLLMYGIILLAILSTILNWGQRRVIPEINDSVLKQNLSLGTQWGDQHFYALPRWVNPKTPWFSSIPQKSLEIINGKGTVINVARYSTTHTYLVNAQTSLSIRENTLYFPGWKVFANKNEIKIKPDKNGVINFSLPKGRYLIKASYNDLYAFYLSKLISIVSIAIIFIYCGVILFRNRLTKFPKL